MQDELQAFLEAPNARSYRRVREALLEETCTNGSTSQLAALAELAAAGDYPALLTAALELLPAWALSPRVHFYAALAAEEVADAETAELEKFVFQACLEGLLATGEGTPEAPYLITYVSDEYDILTALGLESHSQELVEHRGLVCDVVQCRDGSEVWFELTGVLGDPRHRQLELALLQGKYVRLSTLT